MQRPAKPFTPVRFRPQPPKYMKKVSKILIVKFGALGDVIRTSYFLPGLKKKYPTSNIYWYTSISSLPLLDENEYIHTIFTRETSRKIFSENKFDKVISLDDEIDILEDLAKNSIDVDIGSYLDKNKKPTYTENSSLWFDMGLISKFGKEKADCLKKENTLEHNQIFSKILNIEINEPYLFNSASLRHKEFNFDKSRFKIGINPGGGERWISRRLPYNEVLSIISSLNKLKISGKQVDLYLLGGMHEKNLIDEITKNNKYPLINTGTNNSLKEFAKIISSLDLIISSDSLALHLAISQKIKNISFFAPTSAAEIGNFGTGEKIISLSNDYCSYDSVVDNSSITAKRIIAKLKEMFETKPF